ncbi:WD40 repeat-like protein, partial [Stereum hirsutum FP-91666 SS1]
WVNSVAFSPNGERIVSGSNDETIRIWDAETSLSIGEPLRGHEGWVNPSRSRPNGERIVSGSNDETIRFWDAETSLSIGEPLRGHEGWVNSVVFSPNGERIVSGSNDETIRFWDAETGLSIGEPLRGHEDVVTSVVFSPNGERIVSGSDDKTIHIWDTQIPHFLSFCPHQDHHLPERDLWTKEIRLGSDGWLIAPSTQELILWIPPEYRKCLMWPRMRVVISTTPHISLNFQHFAHGANWAKCYAPRAMSPQGAAL